MIKIMKKSKIKSECTSDLFRNKNVFILSNGMGKNRYELFQTSLVQNGANLTDETIGFHFKSSDDSLVDCLIVYDETSLKDWDSVEKALSKKAFFKSLKAELDINGFDNVRIVTAQWLSECLKSKSLVSTKNFELSPSKIKENKHAVLNKDKNKEINKKILGQSQDSPLASASSEKKLLSKSNNIPTKRHAEFVSDGEINETDSKRAKCVLTKSDIHKSLNMSDEDSENDSEMDEFFSANETILSESSPEKKINASSFTCAYSSNEQKINQNKILTDKLEELGEIYSKTKDKFRAISYQKAVLALKHHNGPVTTYEEAIKIKGIGKAIASKIAEIAQTGGLKKLEYFNNREDLNSIKIFSDIHGVGPTTAQAFVTQGFRTLDDLKEKAQLNRQQKIGIKYYDEFKQRIPRAEVEIIEKTVKDAALKINSGLIIETCGSYRRGKETCGDVDILITHPDGYSHKTIFSKLLDTLHGTGFLTDDLVIQDENSDSQRKYLGVCKLPSEESIHRRLDIIIVPFNEYAYALLYFTGSAHFNRSMRLLAKKNGMSLSEHSLNKNVKRKGSEKIYGGEPLPALKEEDVFKHLNLEYRKPEERDF